MTQAYLERIGLASSPPVDAEGLRRLHVAHLTTVPFENLDIHLGVPIDLDPRSLEDKIVTRRRGGYCYELNGAFAELLRSLGFNVTLLEARVFDDAGTVGIRFDHLCLLVDLGRLYLVDVGFGDNFLEPLVWELGTEQTDPTGSYVITERDDGWFDLVRDGTPLYRVSREPRRLVDFEAGNRHQQTSPDSPFTRGPMCSLATSGGRITIAGSTLIETRDGARSETDLTDEGRMHAYRERFGLDLDRLPGPGTSEARADPGSP